MEDDINVKEIESLETLKTALRGFLCETTEVLDRIDVIHERIVDQVRQDPYNGQDFQGSSFGTFERSFISSDWAVSNSAGQMNEDKKALSEIQEGIQRYQKAAFRVKRLLEQDGERAISILQDKIQELTKYVGVILKENDIVQQVKDPQTVFPKTKPKPPADEGAAKRRALMSRVEKSRPELKGLEEGDLLPHGNPDYGIGNDEERMAETSMPVENNRFLMERQDEAAFRNRILGGF